MSDNSAIKEVRLGHIAGVHGIKGAVKLYSECRPRDGIFRYQEFIARAPKQQTSLTLTLSQKHSNGQQLIAQFKEIHDRDYALSLKGYELYVPRSALPTLPEHEFYWIDLIGLKVVNQENQLLGVVSEVFATGANDVLVIKRPNESHHVNKENAQMRHNELLIPLIKTHYVIGIDHQTQTLLVDWPSDWE